MEAVGEHVPETVPVSAEETRGGEEPGDWKVSEQALWAVQYMKDKYGTPEGKAE